MRTPHPLLLCPSADSDPPKAFRHIFPLLKTTCIGSSQPLPDPSPPFLSASRASLSLASSALATLTLLVLEFSRHTHLLGPLC